MTQIKKGLRQCQNHVMTKLIKNKFVSVVQLIESSQLYVDKVCPKSTPNFDQIALSKSLKSALL